MSLSSDFQRMLDERRAAEREIALRVEANTAKIEQLMASNAADQATRSELLNDIAYLERQLAQITEHEEPVVEAPSVIEEPVSQDTREEVEKALRRGRQKSKPDPVKAARKAARAQEEQERKQQRSGRHSKDPLKVHSRKGVSIEGKGKGVPRQRLIDGAAENSRLRFDALTPTQIERAELVREILAEQDAMSQYEIAEAVAELLECSHATAQPITSECIAILMHRREVLYTGQKKATPNSARLTSPIWKLAANATPHERAAAGLPVDDDNYAGTTTRPPDRVSPGSRISIESSQFEGKR